MSGGVRRVSRTAELPIQAAIGTPLWGTQMVEGAPRPSEAFASAFLAPVPSALARIRDELQRAPDGLVRLTCVDALIYAAGHRAVFAWCGHGPELAAVVPDGDSLLLDAAMQLLRGQMLGWSEGGECGPSRVALASDLLELGLDVVRYQRSYYSQCQPIIDRLHEEILLLQTGDCGEGRAWEWCTGLGASLVPTHAATIALARYLREASKPESPLSLTPDRVSRTLEALGSAARAMRSYLESGGWSYARCRPARSSLLPGEIIELALCLHGLLELCSHEIDAFPLESGTADAAALKLVEAGNNRVHVLSAPAFFGSGDMAANAPQAARRAGGTEERNGLALVLRGLAEVHRFCTRRQSYARKVGWVAEESFVKQRTCSAMSLVREVLLELRDPRDQTWWPRCFDAQATLRALVGLVESAEAVYTTVQQEQSRDAPALGSRESEDLYGTYEAVRRVLADESTAHSLAMIVAEALRKLGQ